MPGATFFLKDLKSKKPTRINLIFQFGYSEIIRGKKMYKFLKYSTGERILPRFWNPTTQRAKQSENFPEHLEINTRLDQIASIIQDTYRRMINDGIQPTRENLKNQLDIRLKKNFPVKDQPSDLFAFIDQFIEDSSSGNRTTENGKKISKLTIAGYKVTRKHLRDFQEVYRKKIDFDTVDLDFYDAFISYFNKINQSTNSIGKQIKNLKLFLRAAADKKLHNNFTFQNRRFRKVEEVSDSIYLNEDEITKIFNLDLSEQPSLERTRDLFVIGCYTGLRFSDYNKIKPENIKKTGKGTFLHVRTQKTGELVIIPLRWEVIEILKRYKYRLPDTPVNQIMNDQLKTIARLSGLKEKVSTAITRGGMRVDTTYSKHELVTTHTARRSCATNMYLAGIPTISIMKITGHKTEKAFMAYIKITQEDNAYKLIEHPYFKQVKPGTLHIAK